MVEVVLCRGAGLQRLEATCRLCGRREKGGRCVRAGAPAGSAEQARTLLEMWAAREGERDLRRFVRAVFHGLEPGTVVDRLVQGAILPTHFEALDWLRPETLTGDGGRPPTGPPRPVPRPNRYLPIPPRPAGVETPPPRRTTARSVVAVLMADGPLRPTEWTFVDRLLDAAAQPPLETDEVRPWRPAELAHPVKPAPLLGAMACLADLDRPHDLSGWRLVMEFTRAWGESFAPIDDFAQMIRAERGAGLVRLWFTLRELLAAEPA
jgi:hypothetical protein